jgi:hypothetical protein
MKTSLQKKIAFGMSVGCLCLLLGSLALAHDRLKDPMPDGGPRLQAGMPDPAEMERHIASNLDKLVNENTLTRDQADKVLSFFKQKASERKADMDKMKAMSPRNRQVYLQQNFSSPPDFINDLKNAADLSDEQAKSVAEALRPPHGPGPGGPRGPGSPGDHGF